ncbi:unnamed protein product [Linum tenue]|uniref:Uncharacterized protein n=1 Tax=Linum tenue TaxID=586396 RepID=A0AAV0S219_9ROSI|nr:unnamed protein product [Linum tenue]
MSSSSIPFSSFAVVGLILLFAAGPASAQIQIPANESVPAALVFGDSIVDTGNNNKILTSPARCNLILTSPAKFPLVIIFLLIILYAVPASAAILALYVLITVLFALPSFLILYFAYPSLDWLVREIIT